MKLSVAESDLYFTFPLCANFELLSGYTSSNVRHQLTPCNNLLLELVFSADSRLFFSDSPVKTNSQNWNWCVLNIDCNFATMCEHAVL